jgi:hypothetical protein
MSTLKLKNVSKLECNDINLGISTGGNSNFHGLKQVQLPLSFEEENGESES